MKKKELESDINALRGTIDRQNQKIEALQDDVWRLEYMTLHPFRFEEGELVSARLPILEGYTIIDKGTKRRYCPPRTEIVGPFKYVNMYEIWNTKSGKQWVEEDNLTKNSTPKSNPLTS